MHFVPVADVIVLEPRIAGAMSAERERRPLHDDVVEADLALVAELLIQRGSRFRRAFHVDFGRQEEMWDRTDRRDETLGDRFADLGQRHVFVGNPRASYVGRCDWRGSSDHRYRPRRCALEVTLDDTATGTGAGDELEIDAGVFGDPLGQRRGFHAGRVYADC